MPGEVEGFGLIVNYTTAVTYVGSPTWVEITKVVEFEPADVSIDKIPTQVFNQASKTKAYQAGWKDPGEAKITIHFQKAMVNTIETTLLGVTKGWQVIYADGSKHEFDGFVSKKGAKVPLDGLIGYEFSVQQTGPALFTPAP